MGQGQGLVAGCVHDGRNRDRVDECLFIGQHERLDTPCGGAVRWPYQRSAVGRDPPFHAQVGALYRVWIAGIDLASRLAPDVRIARRTYAAGLAPASDMDGRRRHGVRGEHGRVAPDIHPEPDRAVFRRGAGYGRWRGMVRDCLVGLPLVAEAVASPGVGVSKGRPRRCNVRPVAAGGALCPGPGRRSGGARRSRRLYRGSWQPCWLR